MSSESKTEEQLNQEGWKLASVSGGDHLKRMLEMYKELNIDIHIEKVNPNTCGDCTKCYVNGNEELYKIYTKEDQN